MPSEITMPQQSDTMTEGTVVKWLKKEGDAVKQGDVIAEIETDKATMEMEAFESGTIAVIKTPEGTKVPVGDVMAVLATGKDSVEDVRKKISGNGTKASAAATPPTNTARPSSEPPTAPAPGKRREEEEGGGIPGGPLEQGRAQSRMEAVQEPPDHTSEAMSREATQQVADTRSGASKPAPVAHHTGDDRIRVSPLAKRIADEKGIHLANVKGTGPGGRIIKQDVISFAEGHGMQPAAPQKTEAQRTEARPLQPQAQPESAGVPVLASRMSAGTSQVIPLSKIRGVIAKRLQASKQNIPHFYETVDCDVEELTQLRARLNEQLKVQKIKLSLGDLVVKAIASTLSEHPALNAHFNGTANEITRFGDVNLGIAVALPEGLIVPVLRGVNHMGFREIRVRGADLIERARAQRLKQDEMTGATFTVSNLGMFGVREFSAIINPPEVGILAVGGAEKRAVVRNDQIVARTMMTLTLSCDHRAVDGATAAEFLTTLRQLLEEPALMLA